ncbi:hypothetical protein MLD38_029909 [Melastoma candidum]|uniref:Uncharacterized protein n=1 Tax=Melastoma candidum TaxID=119954 RepID=A0ACB9MJT0_9MYRT|nr:hypothetical protein MLD38_029909 [Melastoma candidum]
MDPNSEGCYSSVSGISLDNQALPWIPDPTTVARAIFERDGCRGGAGGSAQSVPLELNQVSTTMHPRTSPPSDDFQEDCDFSDTVLRYISQILMEEDMEDKSCMLQESLDLQAAERPFYEAIGKKYPPSPRQVPCYGQEDGYGGLLDGDLTHQYDEYDIFSLEERFQVYGTFQSSRSSSTSLISSVDGLVESPSSTLLVPDLGGENQSIKQFIRGVEEASKFLPVGKELLANFELNGGCLDQKVRPDEAAAKLERRDEMPSVSRVRKNTHSEGLGEEERSSKQAAVFIDSPLRSDKFDIVLLTTPPGGPNHITLLQEALQDGASGNTLRNGLSNGSNAGKGRGRRQNGKKQVVDLRTLLVSCAQAVAVDDHVSMNKLLQKIRQHASPFGDANQRLAHCLANGLEARQAGTGSQIYKGLISKRTCAADVLKAYHLLLASCPFRKMSNFISNKTIMKMASNSMRIHIIDFGILYGFQWPTLIQRIAARPGGPPRVRITGVDFPQPGFRPAERVEETGRRLEAYAESFNVPFEYNAIAKKWETVKIEDLKIEEGEYLAVTCIYRSENLLDESISTDSSRKLVLDLIRKISPDIFIHGIVNGSYNAPFFVTRFREALFHFSAMFDILETIVPRENPERMLIEKEIFGREAMNVVACEGFERVERPETYKQWQVRNMRAGFTQVPFDREIVQQAIEKVRSSYHKDFLIDEDSRWLMQGWKGRIIYCLSCWKPA